MLSPYQPIADRRSPRYFEEAGFEVLQISWHALRTNGIPDQIRGFGSLRREY